MSTLVEKMFISFEIFECCHSSPVLEFICMYCIAILWVFDNRGLKKNTNCGKNVIEEKVLEIKKIYKAK